MRLYIDTNVFQMIDGLEKGAGKAGVCAVESLGSREKRRAELDALETILKLTTRSQIQIVLGYAALAEISASGRVGRIANAYALAGKMVRLLDDDEGSFTIGSHLSAFADVAALQNISQKDRRIFADALLYECDAVITCDYKLIRAMEYVPVEYRGLVFLSPSDWASKWQQGDAV